MDFDNVRLLLFSYSYYGLSFGFRNCDRYMYDLHNDHTYS